MIKFKYVLKMKMKVGLLDTGHEERRVLGVRSIPVAILPSCQENYCSIIACT